MSIAVKLQVTREGRHWIGLPDGYPGSCAGTSIMELLQEAQAILPFMVGGSDGKPVPDTKVDRVFVGIPVELRADIDHYQQLTAQRRELDETLRTLGSRTVQRLRSVSGMTDEDSATLLGISRQRVNQLRNAAASA